MSRDSDPAAKVYIGDLGESGSKPELEKEFEKFGPLKSVWVARNPPGKNNGHYLVRYAMHYAVGTLFCWYALYFGPHPFFRKERAWLCGLLCALLPSTLPLLERGPQGLSPWF